MSDGIASDQSDYFWLAMTLAGQGDIVLTYDPAGQGASEGSAVDLFAPPTAGCTFGGACRDLQDAVRWVLHDPADAPEGENSTDPALGLVDPSRLAVVGHSMGALSLLDYLWFQGQGPTGADGRPLPPLASGVVLSGAAATAAVVPIQFQTSDFDGSPTLIGPAVGGADLAFGRFGGIGYAAMKPLYDQLRTSGPLPHRQQRCITVPTTGSLADSPSQLAAAMAGRPASTCTP